MIDIYSRHFKDIRHLLKEKITSNPKLIGYLQKRDIICLSGQYLNSLPKIQKNNYADVIFDDNQQYKVWFFPADDGESGEKMYLNFVEEISNEELLQYQQSIKDLEKQRDEIIEKIKQIQLKYKIPKY